MKCPCCGKEMVLDGHRKIDLFMCYECGYIEGRNLNDNYVPKAAAGHRHHGHSLRNAVAFIAHVFA